MTSKEALDRFFAELTRRRDEGDETDSAAAPVAPTPSGSRSPARRERDQAAAMKKLQAAGLGD